MAKEYKATLELGNTFIFFRVNGEIDIRGDSKINGDELTAATMINDIIRRLRNGRGMAYSYDPLTLMSPDSLVHCSWMESGNLRIDEDPPLRKFMHADTMEEALSRHNSFTTTHAVAMLLPRKRERRVPMGSAETRGD